MVQNWLGVDVGYSTRQHVLRVTGAGLRRNTGDPNAPFYLSALYQTKSLFWNMVRFVAQGAEFKTWKNGQALNFSIDLDAKEQAWVEQHWSRQPGRGFSYQGILLNGYTKEDDSNAHWIGIVDDEDVIEKLFESWRVRKSSTRKLTLFGPAERARYLRAYRPAGTNTTALEVVPELARVDVSEHEAWVVDMSGVRRWQIPIRRDLSVDVPTAMTPLRHSAVVDLDGDGRQEVLFVERNKESKKFGQPLVCFSGIGKERWRFHGPMKSMQRTDGFWYHPPWFVLAFEPIVSEGLYGVVVSTAHHDFWPCQVALVSEGGQVLTECWHGGRLECLATGTKDVVYAGGINNGRRCATLLMYSAACMRGASGEGRFQFVGCERGNELARLLFRRSCLTGNRPYNRVDRLIVSGYEVSVEVQERAYEANSPRVYYSFTPDLKQVAVGISDHFVEEHNDWFRRGTVDHPYSDDCRQRLADIEYVTGCKLRC